MHKQTEQHFQVEHGTVYQVTNQAHVQLFQTRLTRQVGKLVSALLDEIEASIAAAWGTDTIEFQELCVYDTLRVVIG